VVEEQPKLEMDGSYGAIGYISQWGKVGKQEVRTGKTSGETANGDVIQPVQNCVITLHNVTPDDGKKVVALTFDDGPSSYTSKYLDILNQYGIHATFFNLGQSVDEYPDESKAIVEQGSQLASHTYSHDDLPTDSSDKVLSEVTSAFTSIKNATGQDTTVIRPPYGDFKETTWSHTNGTMSTSVLWNMDSEDWRRPGADKIVSNACDGITSGDIILMHDGGGNRDQDVEALPKIIERLQGEGYTFVTVNELMASDSSIPDWCCTGNNPMPDDAVWPTEIA
jgi:peptidoglycan/xylan/chitin deacetylase (PgdA/CDA1 family)